MLKLTVNCIQMHASIWVYMSVCMGHIFGMKTVWLWQHVHCFSVLKCWPSNVFLKCLDHLLLSSYVSAITCM